MALIKKIVQYSDKLSKGLGDKTIPAPYLHCMVKEVARSYGMDTLYAYAIFVWDTREVLSVGSAYFQAGSDAWYDLIKDAKPAKDSKTKIRGKDAKIPKSARFVEFDSILSELNSDLK
jgi:hypothetical protein